MNIRIEPKRIDRELNTVDTVNIKDAEFWGIYTQRWDDEFQEWHWVWVDDAPTLEAAYSKAVDLGNPTPELRAA